MLTFVVGVAVGAAFSPFWLSLWKKITGAPVVQEAEQVAEAAVKKAESDVSAPKS